MRTRLLAPLAVMGLALIPAFSALAAEEETKQALLPIDAKGLSDPATWFQALWVVIIFVIMLAVLYPTAWKNVLAGLKSREERIRKDLADAESAKLRADASLKALNDQLAAAQQKVNEMMSQAAADAEKMAAGVRMRAQQEAEEIKEKAIADIDASRDAALNEIYEQTANLSTSIAEKILRRNLNPDDQRDLVNESLRQLQNLSS